MISRTHFFRVRVTSMLHPENLFIYFSSRLFTPTKCSSEPYCQNRISPRNLVGKVNPLENVQQTESGNDLENAKHFALTVNNHNSQAASALKYPSLPSLFKKLSRVICLHEFIGTRLSGVPHLYVKICPNFSSNPHASSACDGELLGFSFVANKFPSHPPPPPFTRTPLTLPTRLFLSTN